MASEQVLNLTDDTFEATIAEGITLVDFWAPWCGPCRMLAPVIDKVAARVEGKAKVAKVNTDEANASAVKFGISSIPSILIFKDGELQDTLMGAAQREDDLVAKLEALVQVLVGWQVVCKQATQLKNETKKGRWIFPIGLFQFGDLVSVEKSGV